MPYGIQFSVGNEIPDVPASRLLASGRNGFLDPGHFPGGGEGTNFPAGHFFPVHVHHLENSMEYWGRGGES